MTVEELRTELETIVSGLSSSGFEAIDQGIVDKLGKLDASASELGMKEGQHLIENLQSVMIAIKEGKSNASSGGIRLTALDFYVKKIAGGNIEDL
jgi:hypothetical protein